MLAQSVFLEKNDHEDNSFWKLDQVCYEFRFLIMAFFCLIFSWNQYTEGEAKKIGVVGWVKNTSKGTVTGQVQGPEEKVNSMWVARLIMCAWNFWSYFNVSLDKKNGTHVPNLVYRS